MRLNPMKFVHKLWHRYFVALSVLIVNLITFQIGCLLCWASPAIPMLDGTTDRQNNPLRHPLTMNEASLLASLYYVGSIAGTFLPMIMKKRLGRKYTMIILYIPAIINWSVYIFSDDIMVYLLATAFAGLTMGGCMQTIPTYVGEISRCHHRGAMGCLFAIMLGVAQLFIYALGLTLNFRTFNLVLFLVSVASLILLFLIEESPFFYMERGEPERAEEILRRLRHNDSDEAIAKEMMDITKATENCSREVCIRDFFNKGAIRHSLQISIILMLFQQLTIQAPLQSYTVIIFTLIGDEIEPVIASVVITVFQLIGTLIVPFFIDRYGRKIIIIITQVIVAITLFGVAIYFYLKHANLYVHGLYWLPFISLIIYNVAVNTGIATIPFVIIGEIFPECTKEITSSITILTYSLTSFLTVFPFPFMLDRLEGGTTFAIFGFATALSIFVISKILPETKGKTFWEIQELLNKR